MKTQWLALFILCFSLASADAARAADAPAKTSRGHVYAIERPGKNATLAVMVHAGSRRDPFGRSGLAHVVEHVVLGATKHVPLQRALEETKTRGIAKEAMTMPDYTIFVFHGSSRELETLFWFSSEFLLYSVGASGDTEIESAKKSVVNEATQRLNNDRCVIWQVSSLLGYLAPSIRTPSCLDGDVAAIQASDVSAFYGQYYVPGNVDILVLGDALPGQVDKLAEKYFGKLASADATPLAAVPTSAADAGPQVFEVAAASAAKKAGRAVLAWRIPGPGTKERAELELYMAIMDRRNDQSSPTRSCGTASFAAISVATCTFEDPNRRGKELEAFARADISRELATPFGDADLVTAKKSVRLDSIDSNSTWLSDARHQADCIVTGGGPDCLGAQLALGGSSTADAVRQAGQLYLDPSKAFVLLGSANY